MFLDRVCFLVSRKCPSMPDSAGLKEYYSEAVLGYFQIPVIFWHSLLDLKFKLTEKNIIFFY